MWSEAEEMGEKGTHRINAIEGGEQEIYGISFCQGLQDTQTRPDRTAMERNPAQARPTDRPSLPACQLASLDKLIRRQFCFIPIELAKSCSAWQ